MITEYSPECQHCYKNMKNLKFDTMFQCSKYREFRDKKHIGICPTLEIMKGLENIAGDAFKSPTFIKK